MPKRRGAPGIATALMLLTTLISVIEMPPKTNSALPANSAPVTTQSPETPDSSAAPSRSGALHTDGSNIVDAQGRVVHLSGVNWFGFETGTFAPHGLWARGLDDML